MERAEKVEPNFQKRSYMEITYVEGHEQITK